MIDSLKISYMMNRDISVSMEVVNCSCDNLAAMFAKVVRDSLTVDTDEFIKNLEAELER